MLNKRLLLRNTLALAAAATLGLAAHADDTIFFWVDNSK